MISIRPLALDTLYFLSCFKLWTVNACSQHLQFSLTKKKQITRMSKTSLNKS